MPPNSTQNLNAKLSLTSSLTDRPAASGIRLGKSAIQTYSPPVRIVGRPGRYRGGYHLSV